MGGTTPRTVLRTARPRITDAACHDHVRNPHETLGALVVVKLTKLRIDQADFSATVIHMSDNAIPKAGFDWITFRPASAQAAA